jgi:hypothetical protein
LAKDEGEIDEDDDWWGQGKHFQINMTTVMMEKLEKERQDLFKEGLSYAAELAYFVWIMLTLTFCSGMFVENPVQERLSKIRYLLNVIGLN